MNVLESHMGSDTSQAYLRLCLARHIAHWNPRKREAWLSGKWKPNHGQASCDALRVAASDARPIVVAEHKARTEAQKQVDREVGRAALAALRSAA